MLFRHMTILLIICGVGFAQDTAVWRPVDTGQALVNPSMGWTLHFYSNIIDNYGSKLAASDTLEDWPGLSAVYLRIPWSFIEPEEGKFDWTLFDTAAQRWMDKGKQIALRVSCSESWMVYATPEWVEKAGAKGFRFTPGQGMKPDGDFWEPDYNDPVYLEKLDHFLAAFAARYDGNPRVAFVDVGSYGVWGEGHTWASTKLEYDDATRIRHIDLYKKHFTKTLLSVVDDIAGPDNPVASHPVTDHALNLGITLRDDSISVQPAPRSYYHAEMAGAFWPRFPVILEHEHYGASLARDAWEGGKWVMQAVEDYHASYLSIHWWPREMMADNQDLIRRVNLRLGYRIQVREMSWPKRVIQGQPFEIKTVWANTGVAPCYPGGKIAYTLKDAQDGIAWTWTDETFEARDLPVGPDGAAVEKAHVSTVTAGQRFHQFAPRIAPGTYRLFVSLGERDGAPVIALPYDGDDGHRRYLAGEVVLAEK